jgi:hypothetical protein
MIWRLSATGLAFWGGYDAVRMLDCGSVSVDWPSVWVCHGSVESGVTSGLYAGVGCLAVIFVLLILFWVPWVIRRKRVSRMDTASTLVTNLARVINLEPSTTRRPSPDPKRSRSEDAARLGRFAAYDMDQNVSPQPSSGSVTLLESDRGTAPDQKVTPTETVVRGNQMKQRVEEMCQIVSSGSVSPQATAQWLGLLREINDLHNTGELSANTFRQMNTQLLSVIEGPRTSNPQGESSSRV